MNLGIDAIMKILPHRPPFLFLDVVRNIAPLKSGIGVKQITAGEEMVHGFQPRKYAFPGVLTLEMMAQTAAVICAAAAISQDGKTSAQTGAGYLVSAEGIFDQPIRPGDTLEARVSIVKAWGRFIMADGEVGAGSITVAKGRLTIAAPG